MNGRTKKELRSLGYGSVVQELKNLEEAVQNAERLREMERQRAEEAENEVERLSEKLEGGFSVT